ncbi:MAG: hypothetical protein IKR81_09935 [Victivallales bacterium]|nr:hypothetical protein [Victivallales bacterium]
MTERISDSTLGNRFWAVTDFSQQPPAQGANGAQQVHAPAANVKHDSAITNFVNAGGDAMAQNAISKAELFAASHTLNADEVQAENAKADRNQEKLLGAEDAVDDFIEEAAEKYVADHDGVALDDARGFCRTALRKLMVTHEFDERANIELPAANGNDEAARRLGPQGKAALKNAVLGLASMLKEGKISEKAVVVLADSKYYDASKRADMLRLAADSAKKVKEMFVSEARFEALIKQCKDRLTAIQGTLEPAKKEQYESQIALLEQLRNMAVEERKKAVACLKTDYQLTDPSGKVDSDKKFQKKQLDQIRDSLRAFRYDIDLALGKSMGRMERMRRFFDNVRSNVDQSKRITTELLNSIREKDNEFNECLTKIRQELFQGVPAEEQPPVLDDYEKVSANVSRTDKVDLNASCVAATKLSHLTNDRIRYHYSGAEKREALNYKLIQKELGDIAENNGSRSVTFKAGLDAVVGLDFKGLALNVKGGGTVEITAQVKVNNADGTVEVTYSAGGGLQASAKTKIGVDPDKEAEEGLGAKVEAKAAIGATYSTTKTYANLEEFAKTISKYNMVMTPRPLEVFLTYGKGALKGIGHLFMLGATATGFRISRSKMDQLAYSATLRNRNVFGNMGGVFLKKRNIEVLADRKAVNVKGSLKAQGEGGIYFATGEEEVGSNVNFGAGLSGEYSREVYAKGNLYQSFAKSLMVCSAQYLQDNFNADAAEMNGAWKDELVGIVNAGAENNAQGIAQSLSKLATKLTELEESAIGKKSGDKEFWNGFAAKARLLAMATALLTKRAEALVPGAEGNVEAIAEAKAAAKAACEYIIPRLANPVVKVPSKVFKESFFNVFDVATPRTSRFVGSFNVSFSAFENAIDSKMDDFGIGENDMDTLKGGLGHPAADGLVGIAKETTGLDSKIEVRVTRENVVSKHKDPRPWLNTGKTILDIRVSPNILFRSILDIAARYYVKSAGGLDELDEPKWRQEFIDGVLDGLKLTAADVAINGAKPLMEMTFGEAAKKYPVLGKLLGGVDFLTGKYAADYTFKDDTYKTLRFEFGSGGRFSSFTLADDYDTEGKLELTPGTHIAVNFSLSSKTSITDWAVMPKPSVNTILKRAADYATAGNPEGFMNFLQRNRKGVLRLVEAGRTGAPKPAKDKYWDKDVASITTNIEKCTEILAELAGKGGHMAEQARALQPLFAQAVDAMRNHAEDIAPNDGLKIAARFFDTVAKIYTLKAMAPKENGAAA